MQPTTPAGCCRCYPDREVGHGAGASPRRAGAASVDLHHTDDVCTGQDDFRYSESAHALHWEHFEHEADIGVRGVGETVAEAFEQAATAMIAVITEPAGVAARHAIAIECEAPDVELLLVDWLNALIFEMATARLIFGRFEVQVEGTHLSARAWGEPVNAQRHRPAVEVKGATYTSLRVAQHDGQWIAQTVVDV